MMDSRIRSEWWIATVILAVVVFWLLKNRYRSYLRHVPGPFIASMTSFWKINAIYHEDMPRRSINICQKYGNVVRIGPNHVMFASPDAFQKIHAGRQAYGKSDFYRFSSPVHESRPLLNLFSIEDQTYHHVLKRNINHLYTKTAVREFEAQVDSCISKLLEKMTQAAHENAPVDMSLLLHLFAFDCLGEINTSKQFGFLDSGQDVNNMMAIANQRLEEIAMATQSPALLKLYTLRRWVRGANKANRVLLYTVSEVQSRLEKPNTKHDMLSNFLDLNKTHPEKVSIREIVGAIYINLMAGHDVLAITLRAIVYYLSHNPPVLLRLRREISATESKHDSSKPLPHYAIAELPYLDAVIHEVLRIHPNTGTILERLVPSEGAEIDGYWLPGGTIVGVNAWVLQRNIDVFGPDANVFRPERWLEASNSKLAEMRSNLFSFGAGPHSCIGKNIAMMVLRKLTIEFYRRFDAELENPEKPWKVHGGWVTRQTDMNMIVKFLTKDA